MTPFDAPTVAEALAAHGGNAFPTREAWLQAFIERARPHFTRVGSTLPAAVRVAIGFTSMGKRGKRIGECWSDFASRDQTFEIFIVPSLDNPSRIADILTHELVHVAVGLADGHGKQFKRCATALGLTGKMTATVAGEEWHKWADPIVEALGPLPHAALDGKSTTDKKQTTRLLKCVCEECGAIIRASRAVAVFVDQCPISECGGKMTCDAV